MPDPDLVRRIADTTGLSPAEAARVIDDVTAWHHESVTDYVQGRHRELKTYGMRNDAIFEQIAAELAQRTVAPPPLSVRQLRRIVYS